MSLAIALKMRKGTETSLDTQSQLIAEEGHAIRKCLNSGAQGQRGLAIFQQIGDKGHAANA